MIPGKKKPALSAALIGIPEGPPEDGGEDGKGRDDAKESMEMFIAAVHDRDAEGALAAFEQLHDFCSSYEPGEDDEGEEGESEGA